MNALKKSIGGLVINIITIFTSLIVLIPMVVLVLNSFKNQSESNKMSLSLPKEWVFQNFKTVIEQGKLISSFLNSLLYATGSVIIIVFVVAAAAFVIARNRKGINNFIYYFIISGIAIPINNVALMKVMQALGLVNTRIGIILVYAAINIPLSLFLSYGFISTIPREIDEAAIIDGCGPVKLFIKIILPLLKPIISTLFVLNFMAVWNDFTMPLYYLNNSGKWPMTLAVYNFFGAFENSWNLVSADIVLTLLPVLIVFILGQKYIVGGVAAGSVKG
ncbi:raffinose/stachyose/melibiose transport system permease protein [Clostridium saccharoperbutylacetonicum]|uniref:Carbohydrate ABC transporter membrane protein 2, CUT1 family n=1 Tax=Clostridium saccharoperbutylacetonicum N1-4(HMT) TaxID=931276 RepID=M1MLZ8_9CLOT|nr:carbohydrate ABC transporter permease [Clostridium saccharoperbutylacetonicum]AGF58964.1 carbohydrate ABC transporter membrane protein 2, CUT1 family [Clostridium saccharoperbutylacetonicum N1-4(HMT)]NRT60250.1 raffinose/stachyose/melibiose transport system permease protein [Clostridium saccharoperbutylacetonicum]NSB23562.1 raffinose/stachyose/melibiose transport system permease protein [Clostridium saccharoperbutylacetonicum]NSB42933.1 raffinose/stachyose/melibiose transport system permease